MTTNAAGVATEPVITAGNSTGTVSVTAVVDGVSATLPTITIVAPATNVNLGVTATTAVSAGKVTLTASVVNHGTAATNVTVKSKYGTKTFTNVAAGASVSVTFSTYLSTIAAGTITTVGTTGDGTQQTYTTSYAAR